MADLTRYSHRPLASDVLALGTGGFARQRKMYVNGAASEDPVLRNGAAVHRVTGLGVSVGGVGLDGADVSTTTPLGQVEAGTIFKAEGEVEVSVRAESRMGFNGGAPRGVLAVSVFIERLVPVGSVNDLVRQASSPSAASKRGGDAA